MVRYPHPALQNLYLENGYNEMQTSDGPAIQYDRLEELEICVGRVLIRKPARLRGWDLRFLRRSLGLSQPDFGNLIDRDSQTIARWEKSKEPIPSFVDLAIRARFVGKFDPAMTITELLSYVDCTAKPLSHRVVLTLTEDGWQFDLQPALTHVRAIAHKYFQIAMPPSPGPTLKIADYLWRKNDLVKHDVREDLDVDMLVYRWEEKEPVPIGRRAHHSSESVSTVQQGISDEQSNATLH